MSQPTQFDMGQPSAVRPVAARVVRADRSHRLSYGYHGGRPDCRVLCGRDHPCPGVIGYLVAFFRAPESDPSDPASYRRRDWGNAQAEGPDAACLALTDPAPYLTGLSRAVSVRVPRLAGLDEVYIWAILHEWGIRALSDGPDGTYAVLSGQHRALNGRPVGRRPLPAHMREPLRGPDLNVRFGGSPDGLGAGERGLVGVVPVLPATIICYRCGTPNVVAPPHLD